MNFYLEPTILAPTLLLMIAAAMDIRSGKFPNWLFLLGLALGSAWLWAHTDSLHLLKGLGATLLVLVVMMPLFAMRAFGAGDIKLLAVLCLFTSFSTAANVFLFSLFWGLLIGFFRLGFAGELLTFIQSFLLKNPQPKHHKLPYTVAILLGWMSFLTIGGLS